MMPSLRRSIPLVLAFLSMAGRAAAEPSAADEEKARELFKEAVGAMDAGDYAAACPGFRAAMVLYPSPSTQLNIGRCFEHEGKMASAWAAYQRVLELNRDTKDPRRREGLEKLATDALGALEPKLPRLRLVVPTVPAGLKVTRDGQDVPAASLGVPLPVDAGAVVIEAVAPGYEAWKQTVTVVGGKTSEVIIALVVTPPPAPIVRTQTPSPPVVVARAPVDAAPTGRIPAWAWATGGVGVALGVAAIAFRVDWGAMDAKQEAAGCGADLQSCSRKTYTTLEADNARKSRDRGLSVGLGAASIAGIGVGIVGIVVGAVKKSEPDGAAIGVVPWFEGTMGGAALRGRF